MENGQCTISTVMYSGEKVYDVLILGGGPAGLSAAIYAGRAGLSVLVAEQGAFGGAILRAKELANFPGGVAGETGVDFSARLERQAWSFGAEKVTGAAGALTLDGDLKGITVGDVGYWGRSLIIATGRAGAMASPGEAPAVAAELGIPGEKEYTGLGVSYCAVCDGAFFPGLDVYVAGDGESALEEALYLSKIAGSVTVIHRENGFHGASDLAAQAERAGNISFMPDTVVTEVGGGDLLTWIETENIRTGEKRTIKANEGDNIGLFISAAEEKTDGSISGILDTENGYIITDEEMRTNIPGVFAAGDVRHKKLRQVVTAAADGATAASSAEKYLLEGKNGK